MRGSDRAASQEPVPVDVAGKVLVQCANDCH